jgi:hypothetical protein
VVAQSPLRGPDAFWRSSVRTAVAVALSGAAALAAAGGTHLALGFLLGSSVSVLRFRMSYGALVGGASRSRLVRLRLAGYALNAVALALAFSLRPVLSAWTTAAGLVVMNASLLAVETTSSVRARRGRSLAQP